MLKHVSLTILIDIAVFDYGSWHSEEIKAAKLLSDLMDPSYYGCLGWFPTP